MRARRERLPRGPGRFFVLVERIDRAFAFDWHQHAELELTLITRSRGTRFVGDSVEAYADGDLVLIGSDLPHTWRSEEGREHHALVVQFDHRLPGLEPPSRSDRSTLEPLLRAAQRGAVFNDHARGAVVDRLLALPRLSPVRQLAELLIILDDLAGAEPRPLSARALPRAYTERPGQHPIDRALAYLDEHHADAVEARDVARHLGLSPSAFSRFFQRSTRRRFVDVLAERRVAHACTLLVETDATIAAVAARVGLPNVANFNRQFRRWKGRTPSGFRASHRSNG